MPRAQAAKKRGTGSAAAARRPKKAIIRRRAPARRRGAANSEAEDASQGARRLRGAERGTIPACTEVPPPIHQRVAALIGSRWPGKRKASNAWDDRICKRHCGSPLYDMPWEAPDERRYNVAHKPGVNDGHQIIETPPYSRAHLLGNSDPSDELVPADRNLWAQRRNGAVPDPTAAMGMFARLPAEIRDEIFRHLLVHHNDIKVLEKWTLVFPRSRPNLDLGLLRACRIFYLQGVRILYGENTFTYRTRDIADNKEEKGIVEKHVYSHDRIPIERHGHLFRNIRIAVEANRLWGFDGRRVLPEALQKFLPESIPAALHTVTIELPAQTRAMLNMNRDSGTRKGEVPTASWFRCDSPVLKTLERLNCQFIRILAYDKERNYYSAVIDRRPHFTQMNADEGKYHMWAHDAVILGRRKAQSIQARATLGTMRYWIERLVIDPQAVVRPGHSPFQNYEPDIQGDGPLESLPSGTSTPSSRRSGRLVNYSLGSQSFDDSEDDEDDSRIDTGSSIGDYDNGEDEYEDNSMFVS
ncbi:hypothetical protein JX265_004039 [Neoarthrinium moseri]|uniref:Uncharacterized protein n=1 Tax=Neoarthrinium moseri TaxID=1658444 RepID=A0A9P9WRH7_9PEZI|nr:hypothetical protein JX265_004039 [Neoarthrinium moseri]